MRIVIPYLVVSVLWILFSDYILEVLIKDSVLMTEIQTFKGLFFVCVTAGLLFVLVRQYADIVGNTYNEIIARQRIFKALVENSGDVTLLTSISGAIIYTSDNAERITGHIPEEVLSDNLFSLVHGDDCLRLQETIARLSKDAGYPEVVEFRILHSKGYFIWLEASITYRVSDPDIGGILFNCRDISSRKAAQEELEKKNKELDTLIYRSSHDLRGPIVTLVGLADLALMDVKEPPASEYFTSIKEVAVKMDKVLADLLAVTQVKQNKVVLQRVNIFEVCRGVSDNCLARAANGAAIIDIDIDHDLLFETDNSLLHALLLPIVENAIRFSTGGELKSRVTVAANVVNGDLAIKVQDNGRGIPEHELNEVTEFMYRGKNVERGSGVGLYIARLAALRLSGNLVISSAPGKGTMVEVTIPSLGH